MKKILYIDYDLQVGHVNFNRIQIDALKATGADVRLVLHQYMYRHLPYPREMYDYIVPTVLKYRNGHPIINRLSFIITLLLIKLMVNIRKYDSVIIGYCDEISLWTLPPARGMYVFMHRTAGLRESRLKRWLCKRIAQKNSFLVFNNHMGEMLREARITSYHITSHGCAEAFDDKTDATNNPGLTIFHPSAKISCKFIADVLSDRNVLHFIEENNIRILLKESDDDMKIIHNNIVYLPSMIDFSEYKNVFALSDIILLSYPESFSGQVSGVSFECVANQKRTMIYSHPSLEYCRNFYNYDPIFSNALEFVCLCKKLMENSSLGCTASVESLAPTYDFLE